MNGPGNVFSRPMRSPMTFSLDVVIDHLLPIRPVMSPTIPEMKLSGDAFLLQHERERENRAEGASGDDQVIHRVCVPDRGKDLLDEVPLVREVSSGAVLRGGRLVVERLAVDRIDAPELQPARVDPRRHVRDKAEVLPLIEAAHRGRKDEDRSATVAEDEQLHVTTEGGTPPFAVLALHDVRRARARASPMSLQAT